MRDTSNYGVILGSSTTIKGKKVVESMELSLCEWKVTENFFPLELR